MAVMPVVGAPLDRGLDLRQLAAGVVVGEVELDLEAEMLGALEGVFLQPFLVVVEPSQEQSDGLPHS